MAVRCGALSLGAQGNSYLEKGDWQASLGYRWLHSDRHFRGGTEEANRQANDTEVINDVHTFDLSVAHAFSSRFSLALTLPFVHADRSSKYEHLGNNPPTNPRFSTQAGGLGDVRLVGTYWLFNPEKHPNGNFAFGLGIKAPTGEYEATDIFHKRRNGVEVLERGFVDNSIQPGDGGWGIMFEAQGFQKVFENTFAYMNATYLANPRERVPSTGYSVWDAYVLRAGLTYALWPSKGLAVSLGGRLEGVPVEDWFGGSEGSRRPGYAISIEPGITWTHRKFTVNVTAPVALERNREKSVSDLRNNRHGDAAFADYLITSSISYRF
ncbi:MAG: transporter [Verrucomicrobiota bacterium]